MKSADEGFGNSSIRWQTLASAITQESLAAPRREARFPPVAALPSRSSPDAHDDGRVSCRGRGRCRMSREAAVTAA
jgi:hypothetical protein